MTRSQTPEDPADVFKIKIPDCWHIAESLKAEGRLEDAEKIHGTWNLAHDLLNHVRALSFPLKGKQLELLQMALKKTPCAVPQEMLEIAHELNAIEFLAGSEKETEFYITVVGKLALKLQTKDQEGSPEHGV